MATVYRNQTSALTFEEFLLLVASFNNLPEETVRAVFGPLRQQVEPYLAPVGALVFQKRDKLRARGKYCPDRFFEAPAPAKRTRSVSEYSQEELVAIIRPAYEAFLAAGGAAA